MFLFEQFYLLNFGRAVFVGTAFSLTEAGRGTSLVAVCGMLTGVTPLVELEP